MKCCQWRASLVLVGFAVAVVFTRASAQGAQGGHNDAPPVALAINVGWPHGYCHIVAGDGALLIQVEDAVLPFWHAGMLALTRDELEQRQRIPSCGAAALYDVRQMRWLDMSIGRGYHWANGQRFWWIAVPAERWHVDNLDHKRGP